MSTEPATDHGFGFHPDLLTGVHWAAITLAVITGVIHLYLFWNQAFAPFLLAGLGFIGAAGLVVLNVYRWYVYILGIPFTLAQIGAWVSLGMPDFHLGVVDKIVQVLLIALLAYLIVQERP